MRALLIAECGNNHEGSLEVALRMLRKAREAGADIVKFQAGTAEGFARRPEDAYKYRKYELGVHGYWSLHSEGSKLGVPVMFSVWSVQPEYDIFRYLHYYKIAERQSDPAYVQRHDRPGVYFSLNHRRAVEDYVFMERASALHVVPEYPAGDPHLERLREFREFFPGRFGYSDHCVGTEACVEAVRKYGSRIIEKHFTLAHDFGPLRDHVHGATPQEFKMMAENISRG